MRACGCRSSVIELRQLKARALLWFLPTADFSHSSIVTSYVFPGEARCSNRGNKVSAVECEIPFQINDMIYPVISVISAKSGFVMWLLKNVPEE